MALRRKAFLAMLAALAAFSLIRRAFPGGRRVTIRSSRNSDVDSSNCALLANGTRGFLTYAPYARSPASASTWARTQRRSTWGW